MLNKQLFKRMNTDPIEAAAAAYRDAMSVMEPLRMAVWEERQLTVTQLRLTYLIRERDSPSLGELADVLRISGATMSGLIDRLAKRGLVERMQDPTDRRVVRVRLTSEGEQVSGELQRQGHDFLRRVLEKMGPETAAELAQNLREFSARVAETLADPAYAHSLLHRSEEQPADR